MMITSNKVVMVISMLMTKMIREGHKVKKSHFRYTKLKLNPPQMYSLMLRNSVQELV